VHASVLVVRPMAGPKPFSVDAGLGCEYRTKHEF
jgi:hypothetical protein